VMHNGAQGLARLLDAPLLAVGGASARRPPGG
jgi:hypothetical protein